MKLRIAGCTEESVVDGPGIRFVVFAQGCPHQCPGCHNPETWDLAGGEEITVDELFSQIRDARLLQGVTFSGGEPFVQAAALACLGRNVKSLGLDIVTYTGYTFEEITKMAEHDKDIKNLLELSDLLVDGPYLAAERDLGIPFRGSRNQRIISVAESLQKNCVVEAEI
jgi:anaerobic ribonucleoside-triphosphate reductase activating protein